MSLTLRVEASLYTEAERCQTRLASIQSDILVIRIPGVQINSMQLYFFLGFNFSPIFPLDLDDVCVCVCVCVCVLMIDNKDDKNNNND